ncbi:tetratricopeptide repeat protein [Sulfurospirillum arcachonense]|uniref:tetratricopeptide repeat protein n=1 Tax=Sulfurospirillum arcachonense TaxID=57666 RepID=UPI0004B35984|nr:hypothetical protein [Sulfurospirillum arcachonense]
MQVIVIFIVFLLAGCSLQGPNEVGKKSFDNEDYMILVALEQQRVGNKQSAMEMYKILYEKSKKLNYLIEATKISYSLKNSNEMKNLLEEGLKEAPNNKILKRLEIVYLVKEEKYKDAENKILELLKVDKSVKNLKIAGSIYFQKKSYDLALKYFESAYKEDNDENSLLNVIDIEYNYVDKKDEAIALLETHIRMQSCEINTCFKLIEIYGKEKNINGIISTYKKLYSRFKSEEYAKKVIELLVYTKNKKGAIKFLDESGYSQEMLLNIYVSSHDFKGAFKIAERLYKKTKNINYLGKMAIYEYELNKNKISKKVLKSVSKKFEKVVSKLHDPLYLNYYGYLLIEHDINIKKGIGLVQEALLKEPNSPFYLDSLAWGYYKLGRCKKAKVIMDKLIKNSTEKELIEHSIKIDKCVKGKSK